MFPYCAQGYYRTTQDDDGTCLACKSEEYSTSITSTDCLPCLDNEWSGPAASTCRTLLAEELKLVKAEQSSTNIEGGVLKSADLAIDGDPDTGTTTIGGADGDAWLKVYLESPAKVEKVKFSGYSMDSSCIYTVKVLKDETTEEYCWDFTGVNQKYDKEMQCGKLGVGVVIKMTNCMQYQFMIYEIQTFGEGNYLSLQFHTYQNCCISYQNKKFWTKSYTVIPYKINYPNAK